MNYFIGADLGTSAMKLLLCNESCEVLKTVSKAYEVCYPHPAWSEQNPDDWWNSFVLAIKEITADIDKSYIKGIGVTGQMHSLVILDKEDNVIRPAILWNDSRASKETEYLNTVIGKEKLSALTANIAFAGFTAPKLLWLKENEPNNFDKIAKIMLPKDYINYRLTGVHSCDYSDAAGMLTLDVKNKTWSKQMLDICYVTEAQMPRLFESYECIGTLQPTIAKELGLCCSVKVAAGAGDNAGAAIGTATFGEGKCNVSLGTSGTIFISSDKFGVDENNALHSFCHADGGYHLMACILSAASCNKWFCDEVLNTDDYAGEQNAITEEMLGRNDVYFLPYLMGERSPINDTNASGTFIGLRPDTTRANMLLAIFEGVCFAARDNIEIAKSLGINVKESTVCGGGAKSPLWLKILSNVLNITLNIPKTEEGPSLGAAYLSMVASGQANSLDEVAKCKIGATVTPNKNLVELYEQRYRKFAKIYPEMKKLFSEIKE